MGSYQAELVRQHRAFKVKRIKYGRFIQPD
jgi:hypothetical protein